MDKQDKQEITMALLAIKNREEYAVERLYKLVGHTIRYIAFKYLKNIEDAEDLEQDFWADIYKIADRFFFLKNGFGYICKVMNNMAVNRYKKLHRTNRIEVSYVDYTKIDGTGFNCVDEIDELILIREEIGKLEEKERIILQLTYFEDMTIMQIARELKMSKSVVGRIKIAAINKLKKEFETLNVGKSIREDC